MRSQAQGVALTNSAPQETYSKVNDAGKRLINMANPRADEGKYPSSCSSSYTFSSFLVVLYLELALMAD